MKKVIIIHCWSGNSGDNWYPWIKDKLQESGYQVYIPDMPNTDSPVIEEWVRKIKDTVGVPDSDTYFIGHSIGCQAILRYLESINNKVGGVIFVAGWFNLSNLEDEESEDIAKPWIDTPIDKEKIKSVISKSTLIISDNDPYNCLEENKTKFSEIGTDIVGIPKGGHFINKDEPDILIEFNKLIIK